MDVSDEVMGWLLDSDPAIRWQVQRDLLHEPVEVWEAERSRVPHEGWGARLLAARDADGQWAGGACFPAGMTEEPPEGHQPWTATMPSLDLLRVLGAPAGDPVVREAGDLVEQNCRWEHDGQPFFDGEVEACINGRTLALAAWLGKDTSTLLATLMADRLPDGGWNCWTQYGPMTHSSLASTLCVLDGLLALEQAGGSTPELQEVRREAEEHLLERRLFRRRTTGEVIQDSWLEASFPPQWHYDVLRALEHLRATGEAPDDRVAEAVDVVRSQQQPDGRWLLADTHPGATWFELEDGDGRPSRWNTLRALRVLDWAS